jgi:hypothetical protein
MVSQLIRRHFSLALSGDNTTPTLYSTPRRRTVFSILLGYHYPDRTGPHGRGAVSTTR